eukprot:2101503-Prymnesium_polylepis.1
MGFGLGLVWLRLRLLLRARVRLGVRVQVTARMRVHVGRRGARREARLVEVDEHRLVGDEEEGLVERVQVALVRLDRASDRRRAVVLLSLIHISEPTRRS